jgi:hypothetical protein
MAIRTIREIPSKLPHAHLYLDDIEEVSTILLAAAPASADQKEQPRIIYTIGDTELDSIADLQTRGGNTTNLRIGRWGFGLTFRFYAQPEVELYGLGTDQAWATYGKIKSIFDRRQLRIKNAIGSLPRWLKWVLWTALFMIPNFFPAAVRGPLLHDRLACHYRGRHLRVGATEPRLSRPLARAHEGVV